VDSKLVIVRRFPAMVHAQLAKSALEAYEIEAVINGGLMGPQGVRAGMGTIDLMVREEDVDAALEILGAEETFSD
jgi:hypothetical protein